MQRRRNTLSHELPFVPSLPPLPTASRNAHGSYFGSVAPDTNTSLVNQPPPLLQSGYSPHYAQALLNHRASYGAANQLVPASNNFGAWNGNLAYGITSTLTQAPQQGTWFQPGSSRCLQEGCSFTGSEKSVEIHMMDRHLIYPKGWEKRRKQDEWDADPSLKGLVSI
jgi:hypothetical protein